MIDLFVANFPYDTAQMELMEIFSRFGPVKSIKMIIDRQTGRSSGFGFVKMERQAGLTAAAALNLAIFGGRALTVREAKPLQKDAGSQAGRSAGYAKDDFELRSRDYTYRY
ncbi:MAG: RNA-binding protein [Deltaproteobacteria bacterium]|jgi:RNA recognition motif-containing protein|nr:RNA-binding protein [Deltaproteobacteria bacterium]